MSENYYKECEELRICDELIKKYFDTKQYEKCFEGHLELALKEYPLAECQVGYFYWAGLGVKKDLKKAFYWTELSATHGDRDAQFNVAKFYEDGTGVTSNTESAAKWYKKAALQDHDIAIKICKDLNIIVE